MKDNAGGFAGGGDGLQALDLRGLSRINATMHLLNHGMGMAKGDCLLCRYDGEINELLLDLERMTGRWKMQRLRQDCWRLER